MTFPNWLDALLYGVRYVYDALGTLLPERTSVQFTGSADVADDPVNKRTVVTINGTVSDGSGGYLLGLPAGGWVTVRSDDFGFRVLNAAETDYTFVVDNAAGGVVVGGTLSLRSSTGILYIGDTSALGSLASSAIAIQSVSGAFRVKQFAPPSVTGSRADTEQALKNLLTVLATAGLITDSTT